MYEPYLPPRVRGFAKRYNRWAYKIGSPNLMGHITFKAVLWIRVSHANGSDRDRVRSHPPLILDGSRGHLTIVFVLGHRRSGTSLRCGSTVRVLVKCSPAAMENATRREAKGLQSW
jgi:hypothetical protein